MKNVFKKIGIILLIIGSLFLIYNGYIFYGLYFKGVDFIYDREKALDVGKNKFGIRDIDYEIIVKDQILNDDEKKLLIKSAQINQEIIRNSKNKSKSEELYLNLVEIGECIVILYDNNPHFEKKFKSILKNSTKERDLFFQEFWDNISLRFRTFMSDEDQKIICPKYIKSVDF